MKSPVEKRTSYRCEYTVQEPHKYFKCAQVSKWIRNRDLKERTAALRVKQQVARDREKCRMRISECGVKE